MDLSEKLVEMVARKILQDRHPSTSPDDIWLDPAALRDTRSALSVLALPAEPMQYHHDEGGFVEFVNEDVPYRVQEIDGRCAILREVEQPRRVIGYRVYDPEMPAPAVPTDSEKELTLLHELADLVGRKFVPHEAPAPVASTQSATLSLEMERDKARFKALEAAAALVQADISGVTIDCFYFNGILAANSKGQTEFVSPKQMREYLNKLAAAVLALKGQE